MKDSELRNGLAEEGIELTPKEVAETTVSLAAKFRAVIPELKDLTDDEVLDFVIANARTQ